MLSQMPRVASSKGLTYRLGCAKESFSLAVSAPLGNMRTLQISAVRATAACIRSNCYFNSWHRPCSFQRGRAIQPRPRKPKHRMDRTKNTRQMLHRLPTVICRNSEDIKWSQCSHCQLLAVPKLCQDAMRAQYGPLLKETPTRQRSQHNCNISLILQRKMADMMRQACMYTRNNCSQPSMSYLLAVTDGRTINACPL